MCGSQAEQIKVLSLFAPKINGLKKKKKKEEKISSLCQTCNNKYKLQMLMMKFKGINQVQYLKRRGPHLAFFMQSGLDFPQQQKGCMSYSVFGPPAILR